MKKIITIFLLIFLTTGCSLFGVDKIESNTMYQKGEIAVFDNYKIILDDYKIEDNLKVNFLVTNKNSGTIMINKNSFELIKDDIKYYPIDFQSVEINSNETIEIDLLFDVNEINEDDKLLFYSGIVSNNIAFDITK